METIFTHVPVGLFRSTLDGRFLQANPALVRLLGCSTSADLMATNIRDLYADGAERDRLLQQLDRDGATARVEVQLRRRDGPPWWADIYVRRLEEGQSATLTGMIVDISSRREVEARADRFARAASASGEIIFMTDPAGRFTYVNPEFSRVYGYAGEEVLGKETPRILKSGNHNDAHYQTLWSTLLAGGTYSGEFNNRRSDGSLVLVEASANAIIDGSGEITGFLAIQRDITSRRRTEMALQESEALFRRLFDELPVGAALVAADGQFHRVNAAFCRMFGWSEEELKGVTVLDITHPEERQTSGAATQDLWSEAVEQIDLEKRYVRKDGTTLWGAVSVRLVKGAGGRPLWSLPVIIDLTERRQLEQQFLQAQKMEAVGRLAGGIAHDFNNLLTAILGYTDLLLEQLSQSPIGKDLRAIQDAGQRAARLTRQLLAFGRQQVMRLTLLDIRQLVTDLQPIVQRLIGENIVLRVSNAPVVDRVRADATHLEQVLMNLVVNARDALPQGGTIEIATGNVSIDEADTAQHPAVSPGNYVLLSVSDDGVGMDKDTQRRIFEPFFTTKDVGKGTGLGLPTVYGIVRQLGGFIWVNSEVGNGTVMKIYLPSVAGTAADVEPPPPPATAAAVGRALVLLVEDDAEVRRFAASALERHGYEVLQAEGSEQARNLFPQATSMPRLLITDVVLPGMTGPELAGIICAQDPAVRVLYMSGYSATAAATQSIVGPAARLLQKPFTATDLLNGVAQALA